MQTTRTKPKAAIPSDTLVLSKSVANAARLWGLSNESLGQIIGISASSASRLRAGTLQLERGSKPFELAQYLVRLFRSLDSMTGSDDKASKSWLATDNLDLAGRPIDLIRTVKGLSEVANYVDDFRGHV